MNDLNLQELVDKAIKELNGKLMCADDEFVVMDSWTQVFISLNEMPKSGGYTYICSAEEFLDRARELGWCNGYKYGVEYETNGKKPDLPDDVLIQGCYILTGIDESIPVKAGKAGWPMISKFRIVDEHYKTVNTEPEKSWHKKGELPPVGSEIEVYAAGEEVRQIHVVWSGDGVVFGLDMGAPFVYAHFSEKAYKFRPLKTEREKFQGVAIELFRHNQGATIAELMGLMFDAGFKAPEK